MANMTQTEVTVVQPGRGEQVTLPGFGAVYKLTSPDVGLVEHPFAVGSITAAHRHSREDERSIVIAGKIGFRSDDTEVVLEAGGYITKPRGQMHAMWNAGTEPGRIIEVITPGAFAGYFRELGKLLADAGHPDDYGVRILHELPAFAGLADKYGLIYGYPDWMDDIIERYGLNPPTH
jgi:quercetin dioxygenase-like cupin family protein